MEEELKIFEIKKLKFKDLEAAGLEALFELKQQLNNLNGEVGREIEY